MLEQIPMDFLYMAGWVFSFALYVVLLGKHKLLGKLVGDDIVGLVVLAALFGSVWIILTPLILGIWYVKKNQ